MIERQAEQPPHLTRRWWVTDPMARYDAEVDAEIEATIAARPPVMSENDHFNWAVAQCVNKWGAPLNIGEFAPAPADIAIDARLGMWRTWTGGYWYPRLYNGPIDHPCLGLLTRYGREIDDSALPICGVTQEDALRARGYRPL